MFNYSCCPGIEYPNIIFTLHLRRQPGFYLFNIIIPSMVITCFAIITFATPVLTGERISLAIESFLSLTFLCMMVAESIPVNSDVSPLITQFLSSCRTIISAALIFNLVSLNAYGARRVPTWLRRIAFIHVGPWVGYHRDMQQADQLRQSLVPVNTDWKNSILTSLQLGGRHASHSNYQLTRHMTALLVKRMKRDGKIKGKTSSKYDSNHEDRRSEKQRELYKQVKADVKMLTQRSTNEKSVKVIRDFWRCIAQIVDRVCLVVLGFSFVFMTAAFLLRGYGHSMHVDMEQVMQAK